MPVYGCIQPKRSLNAKALMQTGVSPGEACRLNGFGDRFPHDLSAVYRNLAEELREKADDKAERWSRISAQRCFTAARR